jgi:hypothetical protein
MLIRNTAKQPQIPGREARHPKPHGRATGQAIVEYAGMIVVSTLVVGGMMSGAKQIMPALFTLLSERNAMVLSDAPPLPAADFPAPYHSASSVSDSTSAPPLKLRDSAGAIDSVSLSSASASPSRTSATHSLEPLRLETLEPLALTQPKAPAASHTSAPDSYTVPNLVASPAPAPTPASAPTVFSGPTPAPPPAMAPGPTPAEPPQVAPAPTPVSPH